MSSSSVSINWQWLDLPWRRISVRWYDHPLGLFEGLCPDIASKSTLSWWLSVDR